MTNGSVCSSKECGCTPLPAWLRVSAWHVQAAWQKRHPVLSEQGPPETLSHDCWWPSSPLSPRTSKELPTCELAGCCLNSESSPGCLLFHLIPVFTVNLQDRFPTSRPWIFQYLFLFSVPTVLLPHTRSHKPHYKCTSTLQGSFSPRATHVNHPPALRLSPAHFMNLKLSIQSVFQGYWFWCSVVIGFNQVCYRKTLPGFEK